MIAGSLKGLDILVMNSKKKNKYFATSVKRFYSVTGEGTPEERFGATGVMYLNYNDIKDLAMLLKAVAHEAAHLLDDKIGTEEEILSYLRNEYDKMYEGGL